MAIAFFVVPYERRTNHPRPLRFCPMDRYTADIRADAGDWNEVEVLGNRAIVKVRADSATLQDIAATEGWFRAPLDALDASLGPLSNAQRAALRDQATAAGYTVAEFNAAIPSLTAVTLGQVLRFMAGRRRKPRYDAQRDEIVLDGPEIALPADAVDTLDRAVR